MLLGASAYAADYNGWSLGPGVNNVGDGDISVSNGVISLGLRSSDALAVNLSIGGGGSTTLDGVNIDVDVDYFAHQKFKFGGRSGNFYYYGTVGYATLSLDLSAGSASVSADGDAFTAGIGMETVLSRNWLFNLEYDRGFKDLEDTDIFSLNLRYLW